MTVPALNAPFEVERPRDPDVPLSKFEAYTDLCTWMSFILFVAWISVLGSLSLVKPLAATA